MEDNSMKRFLVFIFTITLFLITACGRKDEPTEPTEQVVVIEETVVEDTLAEPTEPVEQAEPEISMVDLFIEEYNKTATTPIADVKEIDVTDKESGHYRTEFRLGAFEDSIAKTGKIGEITVDIVNYGWMKDDLRVYADGITLEQAKEIVQFASPVLDPNLTEADIQEVLVNLDENQEANGYYYGELGLTLLGKYSESYELMLKLE